jgi:chemotaxis protein MotB
MKRILTVTALSAICLTSCVSKKKYVAATTQLQEAREKLDYYDSKVSDYYAKINSLSSENENLSGKNDSLQYNQLTINDLSAMSEANKDAMRATLEKVDDSLVAQAETLEDSINLAVAYNLERHINQNGKNEDVQVSVDGTVVVVNLSDELLFNSGSAWVSRDAYPVLEKLAAVINTEPAMQVLVEGHTDSRTVVEESYLIDNWDLSLRRSAAVVRLLQNKFDVAPEKLIAAGRSSYEPVAEGKSAEAMAKNRRTTIAILPNLGKFLALLDSTTEIEATPETSPETGIEKNEETKPKNNIELGEQDGISG